MYIFKRRRLEKGQTMPHEKVSLYLGYDFSCKRNGHPNLKFYIKEGVVRI
jgi:hypothetical protein